VTHSASTAALLIRVAVAFALATALVLFTLEGPHIPFLKLLDARHRSPHFRADSNMYRRDDDSRPPGRHGLARGRSATDELADVTNWFGPADGTRPAAVTSGLQCYRHWRSVVAQAPVRVIAKIGCARVSTRSQKDIR